MRVFDLFSGIGGFSRAFQKVGATIVGCAETDRYAVAIYRHHFPEVKNYGDATRIDTATLPDFDCLCAGFPCQSFSVAGRGGGLEDSRGLLFFEIVRILNDKRPRYFLLENVKGIFGHDSGKTFATILGEIANCGYLVQWEVLNSKYFGVPQNRERVYIVGHLRTEPRPEVFPLGEIHSVSAQASWNRQGDIASTVLCSGRRLKGSHIAVNSLHYGKHQQDRLYNPMGVCPSLSSGSKGSAMSLIKFHDGVRYRKLTPTEAERLQAFPDGYTELGIDENGRQIGISDTQRYKCLGNAVTVSVVYEIAKKLMEAFY